MTRSEFKNLIKNMISYSLSCKDLIENPSLIGERNFSGVVEECRKAFEILEDSLEASNLALDAIVGDIERNVYGKLYLNGSAGKEITEIVGTEDEFNIPDDAISCISCDEVRRICIDITVDLSKMIYESKKNENSAGIGIKV